MTYFTAGSRVVIAVCAAVTIGMASAGCCNKGYWCDGDPSFLESPDIIQEHNSPFVIVSWSDTYVGQPKCVDFFYVEYKQLQSNETFEESNFFKSPVLFERKVLDDLKDSIQPTGNKYWANITVEFGGVYLIRAVAVDKGGGWGDVEGDVVVYSKAKRYHTRSFIEGRAFPDSLDILGNEIILSESCKPYFLCKELASEWLHDVSQHFLAHTLRYHEPEFLPSIDLRQEAEEESGRRLYEQGRLHNLSRARINSTRVNLDEEGVLSMTVVFSIRLLRISYWWNSFFTNGILSAYHTCGRKLPLAIFKDVNEEEVEEVVSPDCHSLFSVTLTSPAALEDEDESLFPTVTAIDVRLDPAGFKHDVTWFSRHFHNLERVWRQQRLLAEERLKMVLRDGFRDAVVYIKPTVWIRNKLDKLGATEAPQRHNDTETPRHN